MDPRAPPRIAPHRQSLQPTNRRVVDQREFVLASLEYIDFKPWREVIEGGQVTLQPDKLGRRIERLPQIFWADGEGWAEANHWSLEKAVTPGVDIETVKTVMKHLYPYAQHLEREGLDWRHFPMRLAERAIVRFRGEIMSQIEDGSLQSSTAKSRMSAVIQFYRHANAYDFVSPESPMWREKTVVIPYYDSVGFKRSLSRVTTDLTIRNTARPGLRLEDGLLPLSEAHMSELLEFSSRRSTQELHLMLTTGFFTGARLETITSLRIENLERANPDPYMKGFFLIRVGPGTGVATKFDVQGELLVPEFLLAELKHYAYSVERLKRESKTSASDKSLLFLTVRGSRYSGNSVSRLMTDLRRMAIRAGLKFMKHFKFHQTRATFGTWLMKLALSVTTVSAAIEFVKNAMLHKNEATTFKYVKFLENSKGKQESAKAFNEAFTGLRDRAWERFDA